MPAKYVRPDSNGQKNDLREAIAEAVQRVTMKFVATKTDDQLDLQAVHRVRARPISQRTGIINQNRAFLLERGIAARQGLRFLRAELPIILATHSDVLSPRMLRVIEELAGDWTRLRRLARTGAQANLDRRPHHPRSYIAERQPLSAGSVRAGGLGRAGQDQGLGPGTGSKPG
jgi:transposase